MNAQNLLLDWVNSETATINAITDFVVEDNGNIYQAITYESAFDVNLGSGTFMLPNPGSDDSVAIRKLDADGN